MPLIKVATVDQFKELESVIVELGDLSLGLYRYNNEFFAYRNHCPHQGGPACEGKTRFVTDYELDANSAIIEKKHPKIFCPWHGVAYDLKTGKHKTNKKLRLLAFKVVVDKNDVLVDAPSAYVKNGRVTD